VRHFFSNLWRHTRRWLPGVIISLIALAILFRLSNWHDLGIALRNIQPIYVAIAITLTVFSLWTRSMAWRVLLEYRATVSQSFLIINEGYLLNNILPFRAGEIARAVFMGQASGLGTMYVLSTIVVERAFDLAMAAALLLTSLPWVLGASWAKTAAFITLSLVVCGLVIMYLMARNRASLKLWISRLAQRWSFVEKNIVPHISSLLDGLQVLTKPSQFLIAIFWIALSWVIWVGVHYVMLHTISPQVPFWWAMFIDGVLALGVAVPSAPAALGVFEAAIVGSLALLGVDQSTALAYAITMHFINFIVTGVIGLIGLIREGRSLSFIRGELQT
jgi:glycosyltransferase 2 family protein